MKYNNFCEKNLFIFEINHLIFALYTYLINFYFFILLYLTHLFSQFYLSILLIIYLIKILISKFIKLHSNLLNIYQKFIKKLIN